MGDLFRWIGSDAYNQRLSDRRAAATVQYLTEKGVDPARLESEGHGEARPIATNETSEGRARNRRSEFHIIGQPTASAPSAAPAPAPAPEAAAPPPADAAAPAAGGAMNPYGS